MLEPVPDKAEFAPTAEELFEAITVLVIAVAPEISKKTRAKIGLRVAAIMEGLEQQGQPGAARTASALLAALNHPVRWPKDRP